MIKGILRKVTVLLLVVLMIFSMAACDLFLRGTYTSKDGIVEQSFTFKEDNKVEVSAFGINVEGDYEIKDGEITIIYEIFGLRYDMVKSFEKDGNSIFIDGAEFVKEK